MKKKVKSPFWEKMKVLMANRLSLIGLILVIIIVLACIAAPVLTKYDPTKMNCSVDIFGQSKITTHI